MQLIHPDVSSPPERDWRKSGHSNPSGNCVELAVVGAAARRRAADRTHRTPIIDADRPPDQ
jgi:hypothetical protein